MEEKFTPGDALRRIEEAERRVRRPVRTAGWTFVATGFGTMLYWPAMFLGPTWAQAVAGVAWVALTIASTFYLGSLRVQDSEVAWVNRPTSPVSVAYVASVLVTFLFGMLFRPEDPGAGWAAALIALAVLSGLPALYGGRRILRAER
ncbi:hypothetical protein PS9374_01078 [Planomonospora sphaerica]|uniref:Uncharacterized protein n=1 Tax=Planomonospora sphaerica TaxID=161355 RepID=A0A171BQZ0_9ACTN|nr:hypothetical protein [Planomonospora sphaerica]GAT65445.1 hypothetical protein PS9374_01078 [Planomonospora sphaerica]